MRRLWPLGLLLAAGCTSTALRTTTTLASVGSLNPQVTQATIGQTICVSGWTATIRPPTSYTNAIKAALLPAGGKLADFELDHIVPLELGGAPYDHRNLSLEPIAEARVKDGLETRLKNAVCAGRVSLADARAQVVVGATVDTEG